MSSTPKSLVPVLAALTAILGVEAAAATPPPPPAPLVTYSCDPWGPSLVAWPGGQAVLTVSGARDQAVSRTILVAPRTLVRLTNALVDARFHTLRRVYPDRARNPHPLLVRRCEIAYGGRTVAMQGGALPQRLRRVVRILDAIVRAHARRR